MQTRRKVALIDLERPSTLSIKLIFVDYAAILGNEVIQHAIHHLPSLILMSLSFTLTL